MGASVLAAEIAQQQEDVGDGHQGVTIEVGRAPHSGLLCVAQDAVAIVVYTFTGPGSSGISRSVVVVTVANGGLPVPIGVHDARTRLEFGLTIGGHTSLAVCLASKRAGQKAIVRHTGALLGKAAHTSRAHLWDGIGDALGKAGGDVAREKTGKPARKHGVIHRWTILTEQGEIAGVALGTQPHGQGQCEQRKGPMS